MEDNIPAVRRNLSRLRKDVYAHRHEDGKRGGLYFVATEHGGDCGDDDDDDEKGLTVLRCSIIYYETVFSVTS